MGWVLIPLPRRWVVEHSFAWLARFRRLSRGYERLFTAQGGLDFPIFMEARIRGDREVADAQLASLHSQIESLRSDIVQQIRASMLDANTAGVLVRDATSNVNFAADALSDSRER